MTDTLSKLQTLTHLLKSGRPAPINTTNGKMHSSMYSSTLAFLPAYVTHKLLKK